MILLSIATALGSILGLGYLGLKQYYPWVFLDLQYLRMILPLIIKFSKFETNNTCLIDIFEKKVSETPDKVFIIFEDRKYTYKEVNKHANIMARAALSLGLKKDDVVAVMMFNDPSFIWTYLGLLKIGICISFINTNLRNKPLLHCLTVSETDTVIVGEGPELMDAVSNVLPSLPNATVYVQGSPNEQLPRRFKSLHEIMNEMSSDNTDKSLREGTRILDTAMYIFTSGTTGLPKPAKISHKKSVASLVLSGLAGMNSEDKVYITVPLFHSSGLLVGMSSVILQGATCVLDRKFSKTKTMSVCRKHGVTVFIYIGELCRYLLSNEKSDLDRQNSIRLAIGNGLRRDIFDEFKERFDINRMAEFYSATEGPAGFVNCQDVAGSCGRSSPLLQKLMVLDFYKWDINDECLIRDDKGHCVPARRDEPGLLLVAINKLQSYDGYKGKKEVSESKLVRNVCKDGDIYFNSGDLLTRDEQYNLYFNDRIGDTFRWKGENVSTMEVSNILSDIDFVVDACVYGVTIPGHEGRAGMAAVLISTEMTSLNEDALQEMSRHCNDILPVYARPVFLRVRFDELDMTETIKQNKIKMKQEGFDANIIQDNMFFYDRSSGLYKKFTKELHADVLNSTLQF